MKKNWRRNGYILAACLICLLSFGCSLDPCQLEGRHVKDAEGTIYKVETGPGDTYFLIKLSEEIETDLVRLKDR